MKNKQNWQIYKKKRDDSNKVISETGDITTNTTEIQGIKDYDEQ